MIFCLLPFGVLAAETVNDTNWQTHPEVIKIRSLYNEINAAEKAGGLKKESRKCVLHGGSFEIGGILYKD